MTKKIKKTNYFLNIFGLIAILLVFFFALNLLNKISFWKNLGNKIDNITWEIKEKNIEKIKKKIENLNILLVWRWWITNDAPNLTDTIILAKLNSKKKTISLLSIPRDLYVKYPWRWQWKINSIYSSYYYRAKREKRANPRDYAMKKLEQKIWDITWEKIDYYLNVDFQGFIDTINTIWWIEIDVKKNLVDHKYPNSNWWYKTIRFEKWIQILNWERALEYVRSRKSTSDYDRSLRQQEVIKAAKNKLKEKFFNKDQKITELSKTIAELYEVFKKNVYTNISLKDAINIIVYAEIFNEKYDFVSSNMNDTCYFWADICEKWGIVYNPPISTFWASVELFDDNPNFYNLSNFKLSKKYSNIVLNYPLIWKEDALINIYNSTKTPYLAKKMNYIIKRYWFNIPKINYSGNTEESFEKSVIYYNNIWKDSDTIKALKTFFEWEFIETEVPKYSKTNAKIEIIIWKDYLKNKKIFNF